ncbi:MAG: ABC transporter substrate-binding protein [Solirubrobacterales bacterium]
MPSLSWASTALALIGVGATVAGCDAGGDGSGENEFVTVYVSAPLRGPSGADGRDVADGARRALADAGRSAGDLEVRAEYLDGSEGNGGGAGWTPARAAANARTATEDSTAIAYVGDFESGATRASLPVTNDARMLQVSAASSAIDLVAPFPGTDELPDAQPSGERTFGRVIPSDDAQAEAAASWARRLAGRRAAVLSDGTQFGEVMTRTFSTAAGDLGLRTTRLAERSGISCPVDGLAYVGAQLGRHDDLIIAPAAAPPTADDGLLLATDGILLDRRTLGIQRCESALRVVSGALDPSQLPPAGREFAAAFEREYGRWPGRYAAYGYEAMAVVLDAIDRAGDRGAEREAVVDAFFETADRDSILGTYSIDDVGDTTLESMTGYRLVNGRPQPETELSPP